MVQLEAIQGDFHVSCHKKHAKNSTTAYCSEDCEDKFKRGVVGNPFPPSAPHIAPVPELSTLLDDQAGQKQHHEQQQQPNPTSSVHEAYTKHREVYEYALEAKNTKTKGVDHDEYQRSTDRLPAVAENQKPVRHKSSLLFILGVGEDLDGELGFATATSTSTSKALKVESESDEYEGSDNDTLSVPIRDLGIVEPSGFKTDTSLLNESASEPRLRRVGHIDLIDPDKFHKLISELDGEKFQCTMCSTPFNTQDAFREHWLDRHVETAYIMKDEKKVREQIHVSMGNHHIETLADNHGPQPGRKTGTDSDTDDSKNEIQANLSKIVLDQGIVVPHLEVDQSHCFLLPPRQSSPYWQTREAEVNITPRRSSVSGEREDGEPTVRGDPSGSSLRALGLTLIEVMKNRGNTSNVRPEASEDADNHWNYRTTFQANQGIKSSSFDSASDSFSRDDENESVTSSYAASVLSIWQSLASSATDISRGSGYSADQIATATEELITFFQEDELLKPLYKRAIEDDSIGPEKLQRNLRRLFKQYAELSKGEAKDGLEYLAARLVLLKARFLAQSIVQSFHGDVKPRVREKMEKEESSDEDEETHTVDDTMFVDHVNLREFLVGSDAFHTLRAHIQSFVVPKSAYTSSKEVTSTLESGKVTLKKPNATLANNLGMALALSIIIIATAYFNTQDTLGGFPKGAELLSFCAETINISLGLVTFMAFFIKKLNTHTIYVNGFRLVLNLATLPTRYLKVEGWTAAITFDFATSAILDIFAGVLIYIEARPFLEKSNRFSLGYVLPNLIAKVHIQRPWNWVCSIVTVGFFEAPLEPGRVRLRWQCECGETFTGDFIEYREGGIAKMITQMQQSTSARFTSTSNSSENPSPKTTNPDPSLWLRNTLSRLTAKFSKPSKQCALPQHNPPTTTTTSSTSPSNPPQNQNLHLLSCMHQGRFRKSLTQSRIESLTTDLALFHFLQRQYRLQRSRFSSLFSLKSVQAIHFIKLRLPMGGSVEVRHHNPCCLPTQSRCECIPPASRVEPSPSAVYRCIPGPPSVWPPIDPQYLSHLFTTPSCINECDTWIIDQLPKRICGELQGKAGRPADGWGIYYQEGWDGDVIALGVFVVFVVASLIFGVLWSALKMDVQGAFGVSAYVMAACGVFVGLVAGKGG